MSDLPREYLDDISTQRFQENVARQVKKQAQSITSKNTQFADQIKTTQESIATLQQQIASTVYEDHSFSIAGTGTYLLSHSLGTIPSGWAIIDKVVGGGAINFDLTRITWDSSTINFNQFEPGTGATCTYKIRVYK